MGSRTCRVNNCQPHGYLRLHSPQVANRLIVHYVAVRNLSAHRLTMQKRYTILLVQYSSRSVFSTCI